MQKVVEYEDLATCDLHIDALYKGGSKKNVADDSISKLVRGGNQGGIRYVGSASDLNQCNLIILYTSGADPDWPDLLDPETGSFIYFCDNKKPGHGLHETHRHGNQILANVFEAYHTNRRVEIPPIFVFSKGVEGRDVIFRGICVPGFHGYSQSEDLVAVWKTKNNQTFQNYKAIFSILDVPRIPRLWITDILKNWKLLSPYCPAPLLDWAKSGNTKILAAKRSGSIEHGQSKHPRVPISKY